MTLTPQTDDELARRPFDELVADLQRIVQALEAGSVGLEESIGLYREGLRLHAACERRLREAELTITELGRRGPDAAAATSDESDAAASAAGEAR
ncbi:MAG: exodeoxyribonuclease VII small subunit [Chloroflexi bacterium]|nr:MAG: exodeoxyribonuclease VII small subunit [Chloroflexota bacterium]